MRIALTNDDGIRGEGLRLLLDWASRHGEVTVVAPKEEQSGKSHSIELHRPFEVLPVDMPGAVKAMSVDSTPADCVRFALLGLEETFALVISGVNKGFNIGSDIMYSGTVGAAFEAAALGVPALAVSTDPRSFDSAREHLETVWQFIEENRLLQRNLAYNINIPLEAKGIRVTHQGGPYFTDAFEPRGQNLYMPMGRCIYEDKGDDTLDTDAVMHGYISVTPLTLIRTDMNVYEELKGLS